MKNILLIAFSLLSFLAFPQEDNFFIKNDGTRIKIYPHPNLGLFLITFEGTYVEYRDENGKIQSERQKKIKELYFNGQYYMKITPSRFENILVRVIAENDRYLLVTSSYNSNYFIIYDKEVQKFVISAKRHSIKPKKDLKLIEKFIKPYFKDCPELLALMKKNTSINYKAFRRSLDTIFLFSGINRFSCATE